MMPVSIVAVPESIGSAVLGAHDLLATAGIAWSAMVDGGPLNPLYRPAIVSAGGGALACFNGTVIGTHKALHEVASTRPAAAYRACEVAPGNVRRRGGARRVEGRL